MVAAFYNRALIYSAQGTQEAALADYSQAIQYGPTLAILRVRRGIVYIQVADYQTH